MGFWKAVGTGLEVAAVMIKSLDEAKRDLDRGRLFICLRWIVDANGTKGQCFYEKQYSHRDQTKAPWTGEGPWYEVVGYADTHDEAQAICKRETIQPERTGESDYL